MNKWAYIRAAIILLALVSGWTTIDRPMIQSSNVDWTACIVIMVAVPFAVLFIIGIQAVNPHSDPTWKAPSWTENPFNMKQPLQPFDLIALAMTASGLTSLSAIYRFGSDAAPLACSFLVIGIGLWLGVRLSMITFRKKKMVEPAGGAYVSPAAGDPSAHP